MRRSKTIKGIVEDGGFDLEDTKKRKMTALSNKRPKMDLIGFDETPKSEKEKDAEKDFSEEKSEESEEENKEQEVAKGKRMISMTSSEYQPILDPEEEKVEEKEEQAEHQKEE